MSQSYDVVVLGDLVPDVIVACADAPRFGQVEQVVEHAHLTLGGSGSITAAALAAQGVRVGLCAATGADPLGGLVRDLVAGFGVDVLPVPPRRDDATGMTVVLTRPDGDRALLTSLGALATLDGGDLSGVADVLQSARHVHVSSYYLQRRLQPHLPALLQAARERGATTSVDPGWDPDETWAGISAVLPHLTYLLPNAAEAARIAAAIGGVPLPDARRAARALATHGPTVVLKAGADGGVLVTADDEIQVAAQHVPIVDTTGAGDNFDAGFLAAVLDGEQPRAALARGVACGSIAVGGRGGTGRLANRDDATRAASRLLAAAIPDVPAPRPEEHS